MAQYVTDSTDVIPNGMEEVIGSIPIRSTNQTNNFADSQKRRDAFDTLVLMLHPPRLSSIDPEERRPPGFEPPAWLGQSLCINVHRRGDIGVMHQLLHYFDVFPIGFEQRGVRVTEGMEADPLRNPAR